MKTRIFSLAAAILTGLSALFSRPVLAADAPQMPEVSARAAVVLDAPTLFEAGLDRSCARILAVTAPEELRLARIVKRDHITEEQARLRFSAQKPGECYAARGDYLVDTGGSTPLEEAVAPILAELTAPPEENSL